MLFVLWSLWVILFCFVIVPYVVYDFSVSYGDDDDDVPPPTWSTSQVDAVDDLPGGDWGGPPALSSERTIAIERLLFSGLDELYDPRACVLIVFDVVLLDLNPPLLSGGLFTSPKVLSTIRFGFFRYSRASGYAYGMNMMRVGYGTYYVVVPRVATAGEVARYTDRASADENPSS